LYYLMTSYNQIKFELFTDIQLINTEKTISHLLGNRYFRLDTS